MCFPSLFSSSLLFPTPESQPGGFSNYNPFPGHSCFLVFSTRIAEACSHPSSELWCSWQRKTHSWARPLPSIISVASGQYYANVSQISFRDPDHFIAASLQNHLPAWESILAGHPKAEELFGYLSVGVDVRDFFVHFKGSFQGKYFDSSIPPQNFFPNAKNCANHKVFIYSCIID